MSKILMEGTEPIGQVCDNITVLATSTGSKTYAQHIATLKSVWDTLDFGTRTRCVVRRRGQYLYHCSEFSNGIFVMPLIDAQNVYLEQMSFSSTTFSYLSGTTYQDLSNTTVNQTFELVLL